MAPTASIAGRPPLARAPTTPASIWETVAGRPIADELLEWPPDLFALTSVILERSEGYRFGLTPFGAEQIQKHRFPGWSDAVEKTARQWGGRVENDDRAIPEVLAAAWRVLRERAERPLEQIAEGRDLPTCEALFTLHAVADEACAGLGLALDASSAIGVRYRARGRELLARTGSLARVPSSSLRILPKECTASNGTSSRSLSRYACALGPEVGVEWLKLPCRRRGTGPGANVISFLLLPWPMRVREADFRPVEESVQRLAREPYGLFEFVPSEGLDLALVERMILAAQDEVGTVDCVMMPESAIDESEIPGLEALLDRLGVIFLMAGVRQRCREPGWLPGNWVHTGVNPRLLKGGPRPGSMATGWFHVRQNKHHRWSLDERQIAQYHLGGALPPCVRWWEATEVPRRSIRVMEVGVGLTVIAVVCEDLAQIDQVADVVRAVGPHCVYAPLLDGPQLQSRWAARYASVLADDPGSAILTLTSFGMAQRSRPGGRASSPAVALWKDPAGGAREFALEAGAEGILLTLCSEQGMRRCADGRWPVENSSLVYCVGVQQIRAQRAGSGGGVLPPTPALGRPPLGVQELTVLTSWTEAVAEALAYAPDRLAATLSDAGAGAPWRAALGLDEPCPKLVEAIECVVRSVRAATTAGPAPSVEAMRAAVRDDRPGESDLDALVRSVLRTTLDARISRVELERGPADT